MKKTLTVLTLFCCVTLKVFSQCGTPILSQSYETWVKAAIEKENRFANAKRTAVKKIIPIVFHIIHTGQVPGAGYNISKAQVESQVTVLSEDFSKTNADFSTWVTQSSFLSAAADCEIAFCMAKNDPSGAIMAEQGIDRINAVTKGWPSPPYTKASDIIELTIKPGSFWDPSKYFNVWVLDLNDAEGILGYAQFPDVPSGTVPIADVTGMGGLPNTDGVVMDYRYLGTTGLVSAPYNKGRTMVHEVGHWLGLRHTWGDATCGNDYCTDTPTTNDKNYGCPATPGATLAAGCAGSPNPPGKMYQNHMDYSEDRCKSMFTTNQKERMLACLQFCLYRASLDLSTVCSYVGLNENYLSVNMSISPNPSTGSLFVDINLLSPEDFTLSVLNPLGQVVKSEKQIQSSGGMIKFDLNEQPSGIYFVNYKSESKSETKRIVIQ